MNSTEEWCLLQERDYVSRLSYPEFSRFLVSGLAPLMVGTWFMGTYIVSPGALPLTEKPEGFGFEIMRRTIDHFRITFGLFFKASPGAHLFIWKLVSIHMQMKTNFHMKGWAPRLALKKRPKVIRKWSIGSLVETIALHQCGRATQSHIKVELVTYSSPRRFSSLHSFSPGALVSPLTWHIVCFCSGYTDFFNQQNKTKQTDNRKWSLQ